MVAKLPPCLLHTGLLAPPAALARASRAVSHALDAAYPGHAPLLSCGSLTLPAGSRCLLCGANGAGKSTLLQVLGGKTMVDADAVHVLGVPPFHTPALTCSGDLSYLGSQWRRTVASAGYDIPIGGDIPAGEMIGNVAGVDPERRRALIAMLDIDVNWSMMRVSDGQRRRVQICLGLLKPYRVLLCDEITVDLDVCARLDLLSFFKQECEQVRSSIFLRGCASESPAPSAALPSSTPHTFWTGWMRGLRTLRTWRMASCCVEGRWRQRRWRCWGQMTSTATRVCFSPCRLGCWLSAMRGWRAGAGR